MTRRKTPAESAPSVAVNDPDDSSGADRRADHDNKRPAIATIVHRMPLVRTTGRLAVSHFENVNSDVNCWLIAHASGPKISPDRADQRCTLESASICSDPTGHPIDNRIDRQPREHDEVPIHRVFGSVDEPPRMATVAAEQQCGQDDRVDQIGYQVRGVKP